ncbi:MAG: cation transporter [Vicinamibacterales bacterium]
MTTEVTLAVTGMTCGGCENAVKRAVGLLPGVAAVTASHRDNLVQVSFDPAVIAAADIAGKIRALGYTVTA